MLHVEEAEFLAGVRMSEYEKLKATTKEALVRANARLRAAEQLLNQSHLRVNALKELLESLEKARSALSPEALDTALVDSDAVEGIHTTFIAPNISRGDLSPSHIAMMAKDALLENKAPMKRGKLARALTSQGVPLAGKDISKNLGTILWRHSDEFVSLPSLGYWVKGVPLEGVYNPATYGDRPLGDGE